MGLDMYLRGEKYIGGWGPPDTPTSDTYHTILQLTGLPRCEESPSLNVSVTIAYWRKANQIHNWFVKNVQGGVDECKPHEVSREKLRELVDLCKTVLLDDGKAELLPPAEGFFFGSTEVGEWYFEDLESTVKQIEAALALPDDISFVYQSSW